MRRLRNRQTRIDALRSESRPRKRGRVGRYVYLSSLALLLLFLFDQFAGELVYLKADGMVSQDISLVATEYDGIVQDMPVTQGAQVSAGDTVALLRSSDILRDLASLSNELARVRARLGELRVRQAKVDALLPVARERAAEMEIYRERLDSLKARGLSTTGQLTSVIDDAFEAIEKVRELEAEKEILDAELVEAQETVARARSALDELRWLYDEGVVRARRDGIVGSVDVEPGAGVQKGQRIAEIFHGKRYVLAYVPTGALYTVEPGRNVVLRTGFRTIEGKVEETVDVAPRLPREFQQTFGTVDRKQLVRIRVDSEGEPLPLFATVTVSSPYALRPLVIDGIASAWEGAVHLIVSTRSFIGKNN